MYIEEETVFFGVYLIVAQGLITTYSTVSNIGQLVGNLLVVLTLLSKAFYVVRGKFLLSRPSPLLVTAAAIVGSIFFWAPGAGWEALHSGWPHLDLASWLSIGWLALMVIVIVAYLAWFYRLSRRGLPGSFYTGYSIALRHTAGYSFPSRISHTLYYLRRFVHYSEHVHPFKTGSKESIKSSCPDECPGMCHDAHR